MTKPRQSLHKFIAEEALQKPNSDRPITLVSHAGKTGEPLIPGEIYKLCNAHLLIQQTMCTETAIKNLSKMQEYGIQPNVRCQVGIEHRFSDLTYK